MSHRPSDPALVTQFRRRWGAGATAIKFLSELTADELDRLAVERGEAVVRALPAALTAPLTNAERRELARAFGRPAVRRLQRRAEAALFDASSQTP
jgi:hypothetical protein